MMRLPNTLFAQIVTTIAAIALLFLIFSLSVIAFFMLVPIGKSSADDLAALMTMSAHNWGELPPVARARFEHRLSEHYNLRIADSAPPLADASRPLPYYFFLESALTRRCGQPMRLKSSRDEDAAQWYWADIPLPQGMTVRVGFPAAHITVKPPIAMLLLLLVGMLVTLTTAAILAHIISKPLERLSRNAKSIGTGKKPSPLPESGASELASLARSFNEMADEVEELLRNRTTLLAGISHDLRTPMARIQLALEMLPADGDPELIAGIRGDLDQMNCLVGQFLELSRGLEKGEQRPIEIGEMLDELVNCARRGGAQISYQQLHDCVVTRNPLALRRTVVNLLENAVRYSAKKPVAVSYQCDRQAATIRIADQGPGIPEDKLELVFQPFYRLEQSRSSETGGSGLGLSIARQLADANNIQIHLHSIEGRGTTAEIILPSQEQPE